MAKLFISGLFGTLSLVIITVCAKNVHHFEINQKENKQTSLEKALYLLLNPKPTSRLESFSWTDCGAAADPIHVKSLSITPDPLSFPGPLNVAAAFSIKQDLDAPLKAEVKIKKKIGVIFVEIPCIDDFGSCTYDDVCSLLENIKSQCPEPLIQAGFDCSCPIKKKAYNLKKTSFTISASVIPSGEYEAEVKLSHNGAAAGCLEIKLSVS